VLVFPLRNSHYGVFSACLSDSFSSYQTHNEKEQDEDYGMDFVSKWFTNACTIIHELDKCCRYVLLFTTKRLSNCVSGFCHFCLVYFLVLWQSEPWHSCFVLSVCLVSCAFMSCLVLCCVACSFHVVMFCLNTWLMSVLISCVFMSRFVLAHGWWFILLTTCLCSHVCCEHLACVSLCHVRSCRLFSLSHLVSWLLIHLPHLSSLVTYFVCSPYLFSLCLQFGS